jgi:hypothetical protein
MQPWNSLLTLLWLFFITRLYVMMCYYFHLASWPHDDFCWPVESMLTYQTRTTVMPTLTDFIFLLSVGMLFIVFRSSVKRSSRYTLIPFVSEYVVFFLFGLVVSLIILCCKQSRREETFTSRSARRLKTELSSIHASATRRFWHLLCQYLFLWVNWILRHVGTNTFCSFNEVIVRIRDVAM